MGLMAGVMVLAGMGVFVGVGVGGHFGEEGRVGREVEEGFEAEVSVGSAVGMGCSDDGLVQIGGPAVETSEKLSWLLLPTSRQQQAQTPDATRSCQQSSKQTADTVLLQLVAKVTARIQTRHALVCSGQHAFHIVQLTTETSPIEILYEFGNVRQTQTSFRGFFKSTEQAGLT